VLKRAQKNTSNNFLILGIVAVVAVAVVIGLALSSRSPTEAVQVNVGPDPSISRGLTEDGLPYLGNVDAPVTMRIYEDLGCHNCRDFFLDTEPSILENFVATGLVKIEIYTLAFVNSQSLPGAEAATCALDQDKFWEYRDVLFTNQGVVAFTRTNLVTWAKELGLNRAEFSNCFDQAVHQQEIIQQSQLAFEVGVTGTPTSEVNGVRHVGVLPYESQDEIGMRQILETALQEVEE